MRLLSLLLGAAGIAAAGPLWWLLRTEVPLPAGMSSVALRIGISLAWLLPSVAVLWAMLLVQMGARFVLGRSDPLAGDTRFLQTNQRVIANTVEHLAVFAFALLALAAGTDGRRMPDALALAGVFAVARVAFWAGYLVAPVGRAFGMAATLAATGAALGWALAAWSGL